MSNRERRTAQFLLRMNSQVPLRHISMDITIKDCRPAARKYRPVLICLAFGFCVIGVLSMTSPLYSYNPWPDANIYLTTTRQMLRGKMLYRDVFDHKGPYLYLIHIPAVLISQWSFFGVYIIESLFAAAFALISLKITHSKTVKKTVLTLIGCLAVYGTRAFAKSDSAEEYCLPLLMASFYALETDSYFLTGAMAGCIFWTKMTMCSYYIGWYIVMLQRHGMNAVKKTPEIAAGLLVASVPALIMFVSDLNILWDGYITSNIYYGLTGEPARCLSFEFRLLGILNDFYRIIIPVFLTVPVIFLDRKRGSAVFVTWVCLFVPIICVNPFMGKYYYLVLAMYAPLWSDIRFRCRKIVTVLIIGSALLTGNIKNIGHPVYQMKFVNIIKKDPGRVFEYGILDYGFYTLMHQNPDNRFFFYPNMLRSDITKDQRKELKSGKYKYIVTRAEIGAPYKKVATTCFDDLPAARS